MSEIDHKRSEFAGFSLDAEKKILWRSGEIVPLPPKTVEMLIVLVKNRGEVVSKAELLEAVWGETFVEESVLSNNVYLLRKTLNELAGVKNLIQTVPRRGYRFGGKKEETDSEFVLEHHVFEQTLIEDVSGANSIQEIKQNSAQTAIDEKRRLPASNKSQTVRQVSARPSVKTNVRERQIYLFASGFLILLLTGSFAVWKWNETVTRTNLSEIKSIAVLPLKSFDRESDDENLRLRMTDSLITKLGGLNSISVRPTNAVLPFVNSDKDAAEIGKLLEVDAILDGRIQHEGEKIRVTLQAVSVKNGEQFWSGQFDGQPNELLNLQDAISAKLLAGMNLTLTSEQTNAFAKRPTENAEAFENYLKGRYFWQKRNAESLRSAISFFERAIQLDSNFAEAYAGLADTYYLLVDYSYDTSAENVAQAKENLLKAIALNPNLGEAYVTLGLIETTYEWNWKHAEQSLLKAIELSPNSPNAHHRHATLLLKLRRFNEAEAEIRRAKELDPLSLSINMNFGVALFFSKRFDEAIEQFNKTIELDKNFIAPRWYLARCYWAKGEKRESLAKYILALKASGDEELAGQIEKQTSLFEPEKVVENWAEKWVAQISPTGVNEHDLAVLAASQKNADETLNWLEKSIESRHPWAASINAEPEFDFLRNTPRFQRILQKMNL